VFKLRLADYSVKIASRQKHPQRLGASQAECFSNLNSAHAPAASLATGTPDHQQNKRQKRHQRVSSHYLNWLTVNGSVCVLFVLTLAK
jgi:hypothetical protein